MKRKRLILTILSLVVILSLSSLVLWRYLSGKYVETAESIRDYFMWPTYQRLPLEYYNSFGYYPRSMDEAVDFYQQTYWPNMAKKDLRAQYNRGIQMYRFPNSDVQKSVIFEGIKKRLKIV